MNKTIKLICPAHGFHQETFDEVLNIVYNSGGEILSNTYHDQMKRFLIENNKGYDQTTRSHKLALPRYFGLLKGFVLTDAGKAYCLAKNKFDKIDTIFKNLSSVNFGRENNGVGSDSDVQPPLVLLKMLNETKYKTRDFFSFLLYYLEVYQMDFTSALKYLDGVQDCQLEKSRLKTRGGKLFNQPIWGFFLSLGIICSTENDKKKYQLSSYVLEKYALEITAFKATKKRHSIKSDKEDNLAPAFFHEVLSGLFTINPERSFQIRTTSDLKKCFEDKLICVIDQDLCEVDEFNTTVKSYFEPTKEIKYVDYYNDWENKHNDAKKIGNRINQTIGPFSRVFWSGGLGDKSDFGAADIILTDDFIENGIGVSLKYGKGQLKNLGGNSFIQAILGDSTTDFNTKIYLELYAEMWDKMTRDCVELMFEIISKNGNSQIKSAFSNVKSQIKSWKDYQNHKFNNEMINLSMDFLKNFNPSKLKKEIQKYGLKKIQLEGLIYLGRRMYEYIPSFKQSFKKYRDSTFEQIWSSFLNSNESIIKKNLFNLLEKQLSICKRGHWYVADGGKRILRFPSHEGFKKLIPKLKIKHTHNPSGSGYDFSIYFSHTPTTFELGGIDIKIRWKQGQMNGLPNTTSQVQWHVNNEVWDKMFN